MKVEQFGVGKVVHLSCGALTTWAVDELGHIWLRIGREEDDSTVVQAWLPVEGNQLVFCSQTHAKIVLISCINLAHLFGHSSFSQFVVHRVIFSCVKDLRKRYSPAGLNQVFLSFILHCREAWEWMSIC